MSADPLRAAVERVLRENGLSDRPWQFDSSIHSWRCEHPDMYGECDCFAELVDELTILLAEPHVVHVTAEPAAEDAPEGLVPEPPRQDALSDEFVARTFDTEPPSEGEVTADELARTIWHTSRADESTISATGANHVAAAILARYDVRKKP